MPQCPRDRAVRDKTRTIASEYTSEAVVWRCCSSMDSGAIHATVPRMEVVVTVAGWYCLLVPKSHSFRFPDAVMSRLEDLMSRSSGHKHRGGGKRR